MSSQELFLKQPYESCRPVISIGPPGSGKSFIMTNCLKYWLKHNTFDQYHLILPAYKYEQNDSYAFLKKYEKEKWMNIYESYSPVIANKLIKQGEIEDQKKKPRVLFVMDDCTVQGNALMYSDELIKLAVMCRHYQVMTWLLAHADKAIVPPKVRAQLKFVFIYDVAPSLLESIYKQFVDDPDFKRFRDFETYWYKEVQPKKHCCLFLDKIRKEYCDIVNEWFPQKSTK